ncbi:MAG: hypothetical protein JXA20_02805 [Spirochaetes bacterium]|nr:hypothetical protein [Spirochaetota bacterium]
MVTGIGLRSPIGHTMGELKSSLKAGVTGIRSVDEWKSIENMRTLVAGLCRDIDESAIPRQYRRTMGRVGILSALSAIDAVRDSGLSEETTSSDRCGVSYGSTQGSSTSLEEFVKKVFSTRSLKGMQSSSYLQFMSHTCAANLAMMFQSKGPVVASCTACVSGSQGIGFGYDAIRSGRAEVMITGGAEEMHFMHSGVFDIMRATSTRFNDRPEATPRPFDAERDGLVVGEGGGCLVLEDYDHARKRGARLYAEILGFGTNCDGSHLTNPSAAGMAGAMRIALADAGIPADAIGHVNAHATATEAGDIAESSATYDIFRDAAPVSAFKGYMGHTLGACGAIESIITILMMRDGFIAPTRNLETPDPRCAPVRHVLKDTIESSFTKGMNNNFAFGGINTSLIFGLV